MRERGALPADECIEIATALASALAHLHRQGLVHRDIKPSNVISDGWLYGTNASDPKGWGTVFRIQLLPPASSPISLQAGLVTNRNFTLGFRSTAGQSYTLELNTDLNTTNWIDYTNFTGDGSFLQPLVPASHSAEFFRVRTP